MNHIVEALNKGWMVSEVVTVLARGQNEEGRGYLVTLLEPGNSMLHKLYLPYSAEIEAILERASIPAAA
jgi:hypothetical protein